LFETTGYDTDADAVSAPPPPPSRLKRDAREARPSLRPFAPTS
jgi:hypothetical protein